MKKRNGFLLLASAVLLLSCNESVNHEQLCGNNVFEASEACELVNGVPYFADGSIVCPEGSRLIDFEKFECNACTAVALEGACVKEVDSCGNGILDAGESCDSVDKVMKFADGARVCADGLDLVNIDAFNCRFCVAVALEGACAAKKSCGNGVLDNGELCDNNDSDGGGVFADGARKCPEGFVVDSVQQILCKNDCTVDISACLVSAVCGDNTKNGEEVCDNLDFGAATCASIVGMNAVGKLSCAADCTMIDSRACTLCGNGSVDGVEPCEGTDFQGKTCADFGGFKDIGSLVCTSACLIDSSACKSCVNDTRECLGGSLKLCVDGAWAEAADSSCALGFVCKEGENVCSKSPKYCDVSICNQSTDSLEECVDHLLQEPVKCAQGYECAQADKVCEKKANYCDANTCVLATEGANAGKSLLSVCTDHELGSGSECPVAANCKDAVSCGTCKNGRVKCEGAVFQTCSIGQWNAGTNCAATGKVCHNSLGCVEATCGNTKVDGQEVCDASDLTHELSGTGRHCHLYNSARYKNIGGISGKVTCNNDCTLNDSACEYLTEANMGMCQFESLISDPLSDGKVEISFTAETGSIRSKYQFRLACRTNFIKESHLYSAVLKPFAVFTVEKENNAPDHVSYKVDLSDAAPGFYYCIMQYRRAQTLANATWNVDEDIMVCSAKAGRKGLENTISTGNVLIEASDVITLEIP